MATGRYTTNPKRIIKLESKHILLSVHRNNKRIIDSFSFEGLSPDISSVYGFGTLKKDCKMVLEIDNKIDIERVDLGTIEKPNLFSKQTFNLEGSFSNLSFRFFIVEGHDVKASKEKVVPSGIFEGDKRTLIRVEVDNLGEIAWRVYPLDGKSEPVLKINENQEANLINLLREPAGRLLIFQNALEQILWIFIYDADENSDWVKDWEKFLSLKGIEVPPRGEDRSSYNNWIEETMILLSNDFNLLTEYIKNIKEEQIGD